MKKMNKIASKMPCSLGLFGFPSQRRPRGENLCKIGEHFANFVLLIGQRLQARYFPGPERKSDLKQARGR